MTTYSPQQPLDPEHNFTKAAGFVRSAAAQGAELVVLPEYHLTNWLPKDPSFAGLCDQWETYLKKYQELAKECGICIVPGTIVEGHRGEEQEEDRLLNVAYFIGKEGEIVGKYVKKNLWYVRHCSFPKSPASLRPNTAPIPHLQSHKKHRLTHPQGPRAQPPHLLHHAPARGLRHAPRQSRPPNLLGPGLPRSLPRAHRGRRATHHHPYLLDAQRLQPGGSRAQPGLGSALPR